MNLWWRGTKLTRNCDFPSDRGDGSGYGIVFYVSLPFLMLAGILVRTKNVCCFANVLVDMPDVI